MPAHDASALGMPVLSPTAAPFAMPDVPDAREMATASERLRALASLSGSLTDSLSPEDAADLVEKKALSALGATSAVVVTLGNFPTATSGSSKPAQTPGPALLTVVHAIGVPADVRAALELLPLEAAVPLAQVARDGKPLFLPSELELCRYPDWGAAMIAAGTRSAAAVPVWANGELRGVLGLTWSVPRAFDEDECAFVLTLGVMCAQAILRAHLRAAEKQAREHAEHANRSKTQFLTMISHELRTPMNAVLGYTDLLADEVVGPITTLQRGHLSRMRASGSHLLGLIEELLGYARNDAGIDPIRPESVILADVVEQSLDLVRPAAAIKGLRLRVEGPPAAIELHTDPRKLKQILVNLIANAVKFTDSGAVVIVLRVEGVDANVMVFIEVTDTGMGIAPDDRERIFEAFWQSNSMTAHASGGTGLGLPFARQLARLLGGDVIVGKSEIGFGSTFVVSLPARYVARAPVA
ncbi:MAG: GAF domain-containing sensor histidine kinase [Gemmatimonadota bacterium]|nr:GAF domain-containing sensor histidine kinase [Gemmatimonadota bacterium]